MNDLKARSGPWSGFWIQVQDRYYMRLRLHFSGNELSGDGSDSGGYSEIRGSLISNDGTVRFTKRYATHSARYEGRWDGCMISGIWTMRMPVLYGPSGYVEVSGDFEIWPESDSTDTLGDLMREPEEAGAL